MEKQKQVIQNIKEEVLKTQTEHEGCQDKTNLLEALVHSYKEEVEGLRSQVAATKRRELDSRTKVANLKKTLETSGSKAIEAYKSSQEFFTENGVLFNETMKCLLSYIWEEYSEWDLTFVHPEVVLGLIADFVI